MKRAYSVLEIREVDEERREIEGMATTPSPDRMGDVVEPDGAQFKLPLPLLWQHDSRSPIGQVVSAKVTKDGIAVRARFARVAEAGRLKERLDEAWQSIKAGLVRGLSIGFRSLEDSNIKDTFGIRFIKWEWLELSAVTIPANVEASITNIKSADQQLRAAMGARQPRVVRIEKALPGASGPTAARHGSTAVKTIKEQIKDLEATRAAKAAELEALQKKVSEEGRTKDASEREAFDALKGEIQAIDAELADLRDMEELNKTKAAPVDPNAADPGAARAGAKPAAFAGVRVESGLPKGIAFARFVKAMTMAKGNEERAYRIAKSNKAWRDTTPVVEQVLKGAVEGGTTHGAGWADDLVYNQNLAGEFIEYLRPMTIIGRLDGLRRVPFNVRVGSQTSGSSAGWVGQGKPIIVSKLATDQVSLGIAKAAGLVVLAKELIMSSQPSAEALVRDDLAKSISQFLDERFVSPHFAAVANVSPAGLTYGVTPVTPTGTSAAALRADIRTLFNTWLTANLDPSRGVFIMSPITALAISLILNDLGQPEFPGINMKGGNFMGLPVITSMSAYVSSGSPNYEHMIILVDPGEVMLADDGGIEIDASGETALQMDDAPSNDASTGTGQSLVSMFQTDSVAIRAVRFMNWVKRRSTAVQFIRTAAYTGS